MFTYPWSKGQDTDVVILYLDQKAPNPRLQPTPLAQLKRPPFGNNVMKRRRVIVNDLMQKNYVYYLTERHC
jgi:hypothetical protein